MNEGIMVIIAILSIACGAIASNSSKIYLLAIAPILVGGWAFLNLDHSNFILTTIASCVLTAVGYFVGRQIFD